MTSVAALYGPIADDLSRVEETLDQVCRSDFDPLDTMSKAVLERSGKRLRPAIALLAGRFGAYDAERHVLLAASIVAAAHRDVGA